MRAQGDPAARARRYERILWGLVLGANYFGIGIVLLYGYFVIPIYAADVSPGHAVLTTLVPGLPTIAFASVVGRIQSRRWMRPALRWMVESRSPTPEECARLCRLTSRLASIGAFYWLLGGAIVIPYAVVDIPFRPGTAALIRIVLGWFTLGIVPWALTFLFVERALRPVLAEALTDAQDLPKTMGIPARLFLAWLGTSGLPIFGVALLLFAQDDAHRMRAIPAVFVICAASTVAGVTVAMFSGRAIIDPLAKVRTALRAVEQGDLGVRIPVSEAAELGELQAGVNRMVLGLRERERMREIFGHHVGAEVAQRAMEVESVLGGETVEATAMFVDVIASSRLAEQRPPDDVVAVLNTFFDAVVRCVVAEGGYVSKFEGDGALCIFGAPGVQPDHAERALRAARALRAELRSATEGVDAAIGISSGQVVAGNVGAADRYEYTIIGDAVNEASRLTDEAKNRHTRTLASDRTLERCGAEAANWGHSGTIHLRGRARPTVAFEPGLI